MATFTNDKAVPVKVQYKLDGVFYNSGSAESDVSKNVPFEETIVAPGATFEFAGKLVATRDMIGAPEQGGTPEDVKFADVPDRADGTVVEQNPHSTNPDPRA